MKRLVEVAGALSLAWISCAAPNVAAADDQPSSPKQCSLRQYASLPLMTMPNTTIVVPVTVAGVERKFLLMMTAHTGVMKSLADELHLDSSPLPRGMEVEYFGRETKLQTRLPDMQIGAAQGKDLGVVLMSPDQYLPGASGVLGLDILGKFDVELDFTKNRLNLFSQDHCPGKVVYWSDADAELPFVEDAVGYPTVKMKLDGEEIAVGLVPQDYPMAMPFALAHKLYGLDEHSPGITPVSRKDGKPPNSFNYPFKLLDIGGLAVRNPQIFLTGNSQDRICNARGAYTRGPRDGEAPALKFCFGTADVLLGMNELRKLHLYFAFGEKKLYLTTADARK